MSGSSRIPRRMLLPAVILAVALSVALGAGACGQGAVEFTEANPSSRVDPGWLQFRSVKATAPITSVPHAGASEPTADSLDEVWNKVGDAAAELAQNLNRPYVDETELAVLTPFADLAPAEVALLPLEVRLYVPVIGCGQLEPEGIDHYDPTMEVVACEPVADGAEPSNKIHLASSELDGSHVADAAARPSEYDRSRFLIRVRLTEVGTRIWSDFTRDHVDEQVAILLATQVVTAPMIQEPMSGPIVEISGDFTEQQAVDLARIINSATK